MATDISTYQAAYQSTPLTSQMTSYTDSASFSGDTPLPGDSPFGGFDSATPLSTSQSSASGNAMQGYSESPSPIPSLPETYNIHGTYTYLRDDGGKGGDLISAFRDENTCTPAGAPGSPQENKFSNTSMFHYGQYGQFPGDDPSFMKQQGVFSPVDNSDFFSPGGKGHQPQSQGGSSGSGSGFPSPSPSDFQYPPDQKDAVFQNLPGFPQGNLFGSPTDTRGGFQGYQASFYENQRLQDANFNFQLPSHAGIYRDASGVHGRGPYPRRGSLNNPDR